MGTKPTKGSRKEYDHDKKIAAQQRYRDKHKERLNTEARERYHKNVSESRKYCTEKARRHHKTPHGRLVRLLNSARKRAAKAGLPFNLTIEWAEAKWMEQNGACLLTGIPFDLSVADTRLLVAHTRAPSLDQIAPNKGYTKNNTRLITWHMNRALGEDGVGAFEELVAGYLKQKAKI